MRIINITDLSAPELDIYARMSENQLAHIYEPASGLFIAESPKVIERALVTSQCPFYWKTGTWKDSARI